MGCHAVVGYRERTTICDEIIVLSACGTAAAVNLQMAPPKTSTLLTASLDRTMFDKEQLTVKKEKHKLFVDINLANQASRSHFTTATADGYVFDFVVGTYRTNKPGGTVTQLVPHTVNRQHPITSLRCIHSLYLEFMNTRCRYVLC